jgi:hyaluronan synthase
LSAAPGARTVFAVFTFLLDLVRTVRGHAPTAFMGFFAYVWLVWTVKALVARRYRPFGGAAGTWTTTVLLPVYNEPEPTFRRVLESVRAESPTELIAVVDGGDPDLAQLASGYCDRVLRVPKRGKRAAIAAGLAASDPDTDVVVVVDSDTVWRRGALAELLKPFADPRIGGVTPRQAIFDVGDDPVRRFADWIEDVRYLLTVPAQSVFGQVGCLAGRTIAYRRAAFEPAVRALVQQTVWGVSQHIGDDRVLTSELLRRGWRTVYQSTSVVETDAPANWRTFWRQQLRWARSSQRETLLSLRWLWRRPFAFVCFATDIVTPFALYAVSGLALAHALGPGGDGESLRPALALPLAYAGMLVSIGIRQLPHLRRRPADVRRLPLFVLQLTFVMVPIRIFGFATMLHQSWSTRPAAQPMELPHEAACAESAHG